MKSSVTLPEQFGKYRVLRKLGQGGMGSVWLAEDTSLGRPVALKVPHLVDDDRLIHRFRREARAASLIHHPNLCAIYEVGEIDNIQFLAMAYIDGKPLADMVSEGHPWPERKAAELVRTLALALDEAHEKGVIHRDLKPGNVMIDRRGQPVIMDFGLARRLDSESVRLTADGTIMGTPAYMPPEQARGELDLLGPCSDIYSLTVILYELLTGRPPFVGPMTVVLGKVLYETVPSPLVFRKGLHPSLVQICITGTARDASQRFASMAELAAAIDAYLAGEKAPTRRPTQVPGERLPGAPTRARPESGRPPGLPTPSAETGEVDIGSSSTITTGQPLTGPPPPPRRRSIALTGVRLLLLWPLLLTWRFLRLLFAGRGWGRGFAVGGVLLAIVLFWFFGEPVVEYLFNPHLALRMRSGAGDVRTVAFNNDGTRVTAATAGTRFALTLRSGVVSVWDARTGRLIQTLSGKSGHRGVVVFARFLPGGERLVSGGADGSLRIWNTDTGALERTLLALPGQPVCMVSDPEGKELTVGFDSGAIRSWDTTTWEPGLDWPTHPKAIVCMDRAPGSRQLASYGMEGKLLVGAGPADVQEVPLEKDVGSVTALCYCGDPEHIAYGTSGGKIVVRDLRSGEVGLLDGHQKEVTALAYRGDGILGSGSLDGTVRVWDVSARKELTRLHGSLLNLNIRVNSIAFDPGRNRIAAGCLDDNVRIWDLDRLVPPR